MVNIIRGERYKYVHFLTLPPLFFNLIQDPDVFNNLATDPSYQGRVLEYTGKMLSWRLQHEDYALADVHLTAERSIQGMKSR